MVLFDIIITFILSNFATYYYYLFIFVKWRLLKKEIKKAASFNNKVWLVDEGWGVAIGHLTVCIVVVNDKHIVLVQVFFFINSSIKLLLE